MGIALAHTADGHVIPEEPLVTAFRLVMETTLKAYAAPALVEYGEVGALTGIFGSDVVQDQSFGPAGRVIATGTGSIDQCATTQPVRGNCI